MKNVQTCGKDPKEEFVTNILHWYDNAPVGRDMLNDVMKIISEDAELSMVYTNHSIRSTAITTLDSNNIEARHIQAV